MKSSQSDDEDVGHSHAARPHPCDRPLLARHGGLARPQAGAAPERPAGPARRRHHPRARRVVRRRAGRQAGRARPPGERAHRHRPPLHGGSPRLAGHARRAPDGPHLARCRDRRPLRAPARSLHAPLAGHAALVPLDLVAASRIPVAGRIEDPRHVSRLTPRMRGAAAARVPLDPPRQRVHGDLLRVEREPLPEHARLGAADAALAQYLAPTPFIESDDAAIVATAGSIVGSGRDATAAARALVAWVNEHLEQAPSVTVPSAREVLAARRGDCNEHAVLLAALARAAGIPARVVAGAMYLDGAFYYHAWTELWLGTWVSADAVFRQLPTDATHVKLLEGGPERHMELAGIVGELRFTAEESER